LFIEVNPGGKKTWRLRYRLNGSQDKVTLGEYPSHTLAEARQWCERCRTMVAKRESPMRAKREEKAALKIPDKVEPFAKQWLSEVVEKANKNPGNIRRVLKRTCFPL